MIHFAVALVVLSLGCAALVVAALVVPAAPGVDGAFVTGTCAALILSGVLLWYVRRENRAIVSGLTVRLSIWLL